MDLRKLTYFATVAECRSFTRAAQKLRVAQPALSRQVKLLEERLGLELFTRGARYITLTDTGEVLLGHAKGLIADFERVETEMRARQRRPKGKVVMGVPPSLGSIAMPQIVDRVFRELPQVVLQIRESTSVVLEQWLEDGDLDIAVLGGEPFRCTEKLKKLVNEEIALLGRRDLLTTVNGPEELYRKAPLMLTEQIRSLIRPTLCCAGVVLPEAMEIDALQVVKEFVLRGDAVTLLPVGYFRTELEQGDIIAAQFSSISLSRSIFLAKSTECSAPQAAEEVSRIVEAEMANLASRNVLSLEGTMPLRW
ncbi:MAG: LysR family transcriptional regulator [Pseudaminobacter sp.]